MNLFFVAAEFACLRFLAKRFLAEGNGFTTGTRNKVLKDFFFLMFWLRDFEKRTIFWAWHCPIKIKPKNASSELPKIIIRV